MAFAVVQTIEDSDANLSFSASPTAGNIVAIWSRWEGGTGTNNVTVAQSGGSTFTNQTRVDTSSGDHHSQWSYLIGVTTTNLFTVTVPASGVFLESIAIEISSSETPTFDTHNTGSGSGTSLASGSINLNSSAANWIAIGGGSSYSSGQTYSAHQINGVDDDGNLTGSTYAYACVFWRLLSAAFSGGTATVSDTGSDDWICNIIAFKAGTASGGSTASAGSGSLVIGGQSPSLSATAHVWKSPDAGSLILNAQTPTLTATGNQFASVDFAQLTIDAQTPTLSATGNQFASADVAQLTLDAQTPSLSATGNQVVSADVASLILDNQAPGVTVPGTNTTIYVRSQANVVLLTWDAVGGATGYEIGYDTNTGDPYANIVDVGNVLTATLTPGEGYWYINIRSYDGGDSGAWGTEIEWESGGILIDSQTPSLTQTTNAWPDADSASLIIDAHQPSIAVTGLAWVSADVADLVLTAESPSVAFTDFHIVETDVADLTLDAQQPILTMGGNLVVSAEVASLILDSQQPEIGVSYPGRITGAGRPKKHRRRKRWVLPNGMHVYGSEEEARALAEQLTARPVVVTNQKPKKPPTVRLDDGAQVQAQAIYPVYRKKTPVTTDQFAAITQIAESTQITPEAVQEMIQRNRRRKAAAILLLQ